MSKSTIPIGEFRLTERLGSGGFSDVWLATHRAARSRFAAKTLRGRVRGWAASLDAFAREADAVARLNHPNIIGIHDYGEVSISDADASDGVIPPATPYLVMDYYPDGSLAQRRMGSWAHLRPVLADVLAGLAHAHAHGILHLDIKQENVLCDLAEPSSPRYVLTDFGTAAFLDDAAGQDEATVGTPMFMPPERFFGAPYEAGPWSDIYSLAVMGWMLAAGRSPFPGARQPFDFAQRHATSGLPRLPEAALAPPAFAEWLRRAGARDAARRFRTAAEALAALPAGDCDASASTTDADPGRRSTPAVGTRHGETRPANPSMVVRRSDTLGKGAETVALTTAGGLTVGSSEELEPPPLAPERTRTRLVELASTVAFTDVDRAASPLSAGPGSPRPEPATRVDVPGRIDGAEPGSVPLGVGLLGRRTPPLVGRDGERARLWAAFRTTAIDGRPTTTLIEGAAGTGKTRLARWLAVAAHERCGAATLVATHGHVLSAGDGLPAMIARGLGAKVRRAGELLAWSTTLLARLGSTNPFEAESLADLVAGALFPGESIVPWTVRLETDAERLQVIESLLRRLAAERPVVVIIDDVQWAPSAIDFVERLLDAEEPIPITMLLTVRSESRLDLVDVDARLESLAEREDVERITVRPVGADSLRAIVSSVVPLQPSAASKLAELAGGNPLLGLQIVQEWFDAGVVRYQRGGFGLATDEPTTAGTMDAMWSARLDRALSSVPTALRADALEAVERAAALGTVVSSSEWHGVCADLEPRAVGAARAALVRGRLATLDPHGWSFAHALLARAVTQAADEAGRAAAQHGRVAAYLQAAPGGASLDAAGRIAAHLERAGRLAEAFDTAYLAFRQDPGRDPARSRLLVTRLERCLRTMNPRERVAREVQYRVADMQTQRLELPASAVRERVRELRESIDVEEFPGEAWDAALLVVRSQEDDDYVLKSEGRFRELVAWAERLGDAERECRARAWLAQILELGAHSSEAIEVVTPALAKLPDTPLGRRESLRLLQSRARSCFDLGRYDEGLAALQEINEISRHGAGRDMLAVHEMLRSETLLLFGAFDLARSCLERGLDIALSFPTHLDSLCLVYRGALEARAAEWDATIEAMERVLEAHGGDPKAGLSAYAAGYASTAVALRGDEDMWDSVIVPALDTLKGWDIHEQILERAVADAGIVWLRAGDGERGLAALERAHWGLTAYLDGATRDRVVALVAAIRAGDSTALDAAPRFLDEVHSQIAGAPPEWLVQSARAASYPAASQA